MMVTSSVQASSNAVTSRLILHVQCLPSAAALPSLHVPLATTMLPVGHQRVVLSPSEALGHHYPIPPPLRRLLPSTASTAAS